ncbi:hypothetical protein RHGRI_016785 [Rhododendron griersonianum]|uniref:Transcriptional regulator n=1 Tax=Rhododendron griersonianum TaxID=479676 RepID=A0AAV6JVI0_9ERIC|nr:hypothetical protein RHGRI_016785 [Rhododendron griersonianum]
MTDNQQTPPPADLKDEFARKMAKLIAELKTNNQAELQALRSEIRKLRAQLVDVETAFRLNIARTWDELTTVLLAHEAKSSKRPKVLRRVQRAKSKKNKAPTPDSSKESLEKSSK